MLFTVLLKPLEKLLNAYLNYDSEKSAQLSLLSGTSIQLELQPLHFHCYLIVKDCNVTLTKYHNETPNAIIRGTPLALLGVLYQKGMTLPENVTITGDLTVVQTLHNIFNEIEIDWEEILSHYIGDVAAHTICQRLHKLQQCQKYTTKSLTRNMTEYLQEECRYFPPRTECEDFFHEIDILRDDVDRLSARLNFLLSSES